jgi:hypothetical protein
MSPTQRLTPVLAAVDHLLLGVSDLDHGIAWVEQRTGLRAAMGGVHPGMGTRNALLSLGSGHYLEIIAPDPDQSLYAFPVDVRGHSEPRLVTFAAATADIEGVAAVARQAGYAVTGPAAGSRKRPTGETISWRTLHVENAMGGGGVAPVPFFIQWDPGAAHPSATTPAGCTVESLALEHPDPSGLAAALRTFGLEAQVLAGPGPRLVAVLETPRGRLELT